MIKWTGQRDKKTFEYEQMRRIRLSCTCIKYHPGLYYQFIRSLVSNDYVHGHWWPCSDCSNAQADLGLRCPHIPEDTFLHCAVQITLSRKFIDIVCWQPYRAVHDINLFSLTDAVPHKISAGMQCSQQDCM